MQAQQARRDRLPLRRRRPLPSKIHIPRERGRLMKLSLLVLTPGKQEGKKIEVKLPQFLVGRDPQCHLRPASPLISKRHCALIQRDGKVFVRDFGSTNGTYVNDERVEGERELRNDDQLKIGPIQLTV